MFEVAFKYHVPDAEKRSCYDCYWCRGAVSWWCKNEKSGVKIPGGCGCKFWKAARTWEELSPLERWEPTRSGYLIIQDEHERPPASSEKNTATGAPEKEESPDGNVPSSSVLQGAVLLLMGVTVLMIMTYWLMSSMPSR